MLMLFFSDMGGGNLGGGGNMMGNMGGGGGMGGGMGMGKNNLLLHVLKNNVEN